MDSGSVFPSYQGKWPSIGFQPILGSRGGRAGPRALSAGLGSILGCPSSLDESTSGGGPDEPLVSGLVFAGLVAFAGGERTRRSSTCMMPPGPYSSCCATLLAVTCGTSDTGPPQIPGLAATEGGIAVAVAGPSNTPAIATTAATADGGGTAAGADEEFA